MAALSMKVFISYSHRDAQVLERLHVHLASLRREGLIEEWFDRDILAGDVLDAEIDRELEEAEMFLLLISPDFIASDYCVDKEMRRALERHEVGTARVVPVIIEPCDWASIGMLRRLKAVPEDGLPISEWANANNAYLNIIQELRRVISTELRSTKKVDKADSSQASKEAPARYRIRRDFDEIDRGEFRDAAFMAMKEYFRRASAEINSIDGLKARFVDKLPDTFICTVVNSSRNRGVAHITLHLGSSEHSLSDIYYSFNENAPRSTANGGFSVSSDEYQLFLSPSMFSVEKEKFSPEQAAEHVWNEFIEQAGITHA
jgi:hypothetical protein